MSFFIGRFLLRDCVVGLTKKFQMFEALDQAMEKKRITARFDEELVKLRQLWRGLTTGGSAITTR